MAYFDFLVGWIHLDVMEVLFLPIATRTMTSTRHSKQPARDKAWIPLTSVTEEERSLVIFLSYLKQVPSEVL